MPYVEKSIGLGRKKNTGAIAASFHGWGVLHVRMRRPELFSSACPLVPVYRGFKFGRFLSKVLKKQ